MGRSWQQPAVQAGKEGHMAKEGIEYFPLNCRLDEKFELIEAEFGLKGFAVSCSSGSMGSMVITVNGMRISPFCLRDRFFPAAGRTI